MIRNVLATVAGLVVGMCLNMALAMLNSYVLFPMPAGVTFEDAPGFAAYVASLPPVAFLVVIAAHVGQAALGAWVAARLAARRPLIPALVIGALTAVACVMNLLQLPGPAWMSIEVPLCPGRPVRAGPGGGAAARVMPLGRRGRRAATSAALAVALAGAPAPALAYPWTIKDGYAHCASCHVDPSGGGTLTDYGRAQAEILVRTHFGPAAVEDPGKMAEFAFGVLPLPAPLSLQVDTRGIVIPQPGNVRAILMQADLRGAVEAGPVVASASIGAVSEGGEAAWLTSNTASGWNLVSRECWAGVRPLKGLLLRAGRMNLPFGLRTEDHLLFVRSATRTDLNDQQQVGAAASYTGKQVRAEVMGIAGNLQVRPDSFRERGYSAYATFSVSKRVEVGASSMVTAAETDVETLAPRTRQAHGLFTRASPGSRWRSWPKRTCSRTTTARARPGRVSPRWGSWTSSRCRGCT